MKKIYMQPTIKVVVLKRRQHLLAGSTDAPVGGGSQGNGDALAPAMTDFENFGY